MTEHPESGELIDDRYCHRCAWHDEECQIAYCNYLDRWDLRKLVKAGIDLHKLAREVKA